MPGGGFPIDVVEGVPVVTAPEEIDITNADALRSCLLNAVTTWQGTLVVDMTKTQFCDVSGLHVLVAARNRAEAEGHEVLLVISSTAVLRVLALTGMDRLIPNFSSLAEALGRTGRLDDRPRQSRAPMTHQSQPELPPEAAPVPAPSRGLAT